MRMPKMTSEVLTFSGGRLPLKRPGGGHTLRAWDAADEQLLEQVLERCTPQSHPRVLIIDDLLATGLLGFGTRAQRPCSLSADSFRRAGFTSIMSTLAGLASTIASTNRFFFSLGG